MSIAITNPLRARLVLRGASVVGLLGVVLASMSINSFMREIALGDALLFVLAVVLSPFYFVYMSVMRTHWPPVELALFAIVATPAHAIYPRTITGVVTVLGLLAWFLCEFMVAAMPA